MNETLCQCQTTRDEQSTTSITVEIPTGLLEQLREAAVLAKTDCQSLLLCYARQGLLDSGMKLKRGRFVEHVREVLDQHGVQKNAIEEIFNKFLYWSPVVNADSDHRSLGQSSPVQGNFARWSAEGGCRKGMQRGERAMNLPALAFLARCLADENRLRILLAVREEKKSVSRIVEELGLSQPLVSHHLKELRRALLVKVERSGPFVHYELADARILGILTGLDELGRDLLKERTTF